MNKEKVLHIKENIDNHTVRVSLVDFNIEDSIINFSYDSCIIEDFSIKETKDYIIINGYKKDIYIQFEPLGIYDIEENNLKDKIDHRYNRIDYEDKKYLFGLIKYRRYYIFNHIGKSSIAVLKTKKKYCKKFPKSWIYFTGCDSLNLI